MQSDYTTEPKVIRIYEEGGNWSIDGLDPDTDKYTQAVWDYDDFDVAVANIPDFIRYGDENSYDHKFFWPTDRTYKVGQRVYLTEDKVNARVVAITADGNYVVQTYGDQSYITVFSEEFMDNL